MDVDYIAELITEDPDIFSEEEVINESFEILRKRIFDRIANYISSGGEDKKQTEMEGRFAQALRKGVSMYHFLDAIKDNKCIGDLGSTYLKGIMGRSIAKIWPHSKGRVRAIMGLSPLKRRRKDERQKKERLTQSILRSKR